MTNSTPIPEKPKSSNIINDKFKITKKRRRSSVTGNANRSGIAAAVALAKAATVPFPLKRNSVSSSCSTSPPAEMGKLDSSPSTIMHSPINELIEPGEKSIKLPLKAPPNEYRDKYIQTFIESHHDDDCVLTVPEESMINFLPLSLKPLRSKNIQDFGVFIDVNCGKSAYIQEYSGMIDFIKQYTNNPDNKYEILGSPTRNVLFHPKWPIFIDANGTSGDNNVLEHLRCSCTPNVELVTIRTLESKPKIKFVLRALRNIQSGEELHIAWQWDINHPMWHVIQDLQDFSSLASKDKCRVSRAAEALILSNQCACDDVHECKLRKVQKASREYINSLSTVMQNKIQENLDAGNLLTKPC
ncbi:chromosome organization [Nakaseomyces bracarensis]|uniref:Chromosome organization n=1 Tax=Nakaseomyces bracarensis TaxID=273131 RepID=A0ABR4NV28_9SACH